MIVKVSGKELEFDVSITTVGEIFEQIRWELNKKNRIISSIVVDGVEIFNNHESYVDERLGTISAMEVKGATKQELAQENADLVAHHLESIVPLLTKAAKSFRNGITEEDWLEFEGCIRTMLFIEEVICNIHGMLKSADKTTLTNAWEKVVTEYQTLNEVFKDLEEYLDHNQESQAADAIEKTMKPVVEKVLTLIDEAF